MSFFSTEIKRVDGGGVSFLVSCGVKQHVQDDTLVCIKTLLVGIRVLMSSRQVMANRRKVW